MHSKLQNRWFHSGTIRLPFFYGWIIVIVAGLAHFSSGPGQTYVASVFMGPILEEFGWSKTLFSAIYTAGSLTAAALMFLVGRLIDRFGVRVMLTAGCVLLGGATLWMTTVNHPAQAYIGIAALRTLGQGTLPLVATTMVALWFVRKRGKTIAIASLGAGLSQAVFPLLALYLISRFGWQDAWIGLALIVWVVLLLPAFSLFGPMMLAGNFAGGLLCDRIQNRYVLASGQLLYVGTMLFTFVISQPPHAFLYMAFAGFSCGIIMTTNAVIWPNYFGRSELGSIRGLSTTAGIGFSALGALPFGFVFDMTGSYDKAILILLVLPVICGVAALLAAKPRKRGEAAVTGSSTQFARPAPEERE